MHGGNAYGDPPGRRQLLSTDQTTASTILQLRLGHDYPRASLVRLPNYSSTQRQCSARVQSVKHLLLGCRTYQNEREAAGIIRETTLHSLLFTSKGTTMLRDFVQSAKVATRRWLLQGGSEDDSDDKWGWGRLGAKAWLYSCTIGPSPGPEGGYRHTLLHACKSCLLANVMAQSRIVTRHAIQCDH